MSDNPNTAPSPADDLTPEELADASRMRPLEQLPSPWEIQGNPQITSQVSLTALSPADRQMVLERAGPGADAEAIDTALNGFLIENSAQFRIKCGAGDGATVPERTALAQLNELRLMGEELARIDAELAEIVDHRTEADGTATPVYRLQGQARTGREHRRAEVLHRMALVAGIEGEAELERAAEAEALKRRQLKAQVEEQREATRRAHEMARERRISERAEAKAKFL